MRKFMIVAAGLCMAAAGGVIVYLIFFSGRGETYEVELTDYHAPPQSDDFLADDRLDDKKPAFDATLVDRRPLGKDGAWLLNASAAVIKLDVPPIRPDVDDRLLTLHPSYADTAGENSDALPILPSVNMLDGKAKQFDDGLYAALDQAYYNGLPGKLPSHVQLIKRIAERLDKDSSATSFLAAGLSMVGVTIEAPNKLPTDRFLTQFRKNEVLSKPIGFYTWSDKLRQLFLFMRFFQHEFDAQNEADLGIPRALASVLAEDKQLSDDYRQAIAFYSRLTNPSLCLSLADVPTTGQLDGATLEQLARDKHLAHSSVAVFPPKTSKETVLFEKLFPQGVPPDVDLMKELVKRIRSGEVSLKPGSDSGWYDYLVYALETLLLPEKGAEKDKLLLTKAYKKRMLEAFKALVTKRRETHVRELGVGMRTAAPDKLPPLDSVSPRLRVEPGPTYYLRTARAYAFLTNFLESSVGKEGLQKLHGLKKDGEREPDLYTELTRMRDLFYGLYLVSAEDIGLKPAFEADEEVDQEHCYKLAGDWLPKALADPDLTADTRVAVPIYADGSVTRMWATLGVRLAKLEAGYARPPSLKPAQGEGTWKTAEPHQLQNAYYLIPVDEFVEVELKGNRVLTREELRAICDREKTKEAILEELRK